MARVPTKYAVIIAGGGMVGLTLAVTLSRTFAGDLPVAVLDPGPMAPVVAVPKAHDVRASAYGAASRRMLEAVGIWSAMAASAQDVAGIDITDSRLTDGIRPILLSYDTVLDGGECAMTIAPNADLLAALYAAAAMAPGVALYAATQIAETRRTAAGVTVLLSDGRELSAALLAAADGRQSQQRSDAGIKAVQWGHEQAGIVTKIRHSEPHGARAVQHFLPGGPFALLPLPGNISCITWSEGAGEAAALMALSDVAFLDQVERRVAGRLGTIELAGARQSWPLMTFLSRSLVADRLALIGDAARGVHPIAGQGLNLGLRDVAALAEVIAEAARVGQDIGSLAVLEGYERWRRADGVLSAASFDIINRLFSNDLPLLRTLRDSGLGVVDRLPLVKRKLVAEAAGLTGDLPRLMRGVLP